MPSSGDRRSWFGLGRRPRLPYYLQAAGSRRARLQVDKGRRIKLQPERGKRLKGLDEFEKPEFVGRIERVERRQKLAWWAMVAAAFALGGAIGWSLI